MAIKENELIISGTSSGDPSVGIDSGVFQINTGKNVTVEDLASMITDKERLKKNICENIDKLFLNREAIPYAHWLEFLVKEIFQELHDNGNIKIIFLIEDEEVLKEKAAETTPEGLEKI